MALTGEVEATGVHDRGDIDPSRISALGGTLADVASAVRTATGATDLEALGKLVVAVRSQTPVFVRDVAAVEMGSGKPGCVAFEDGSSAPLRSPALRPIPTPPSWCAWSTRSRAGRF